MSEARHDGVYRRIKHTPMRDLLRGRITARLDWRGAIASARLPEAVEGLLIKLVGRTRLWRLEKADVARELVGHFEDALSNGQSPEDAIASFGDWKRGVKLIRRAKKRGRPLLWHAWRWSFWSVAGLIGLYGVLVLYYMGVEPKITTDYTIAINKQAAAVAEQDRAWPGFRDAVISLYQDPAYAEAGSDEAMAIDEILGDRIGPDHPEWPRLEAFLLAHRDDLANLREAVAKPGFGYVVGRKLKREDLPAIYPDADPSEYDDLIARSGPNADGEPPNLIAANLGPLGVQRMACRLLMADARRALADGDSQRAMDNIEACLRIADHSDEVSLLINQVVAISIYARTLDLCSELVFDNPASFSDEQLTRLAHLIVPAQDYRFDLGPEKLFLYDMIQRVYTDEGDGEGRFHQPGWVEALNTDHQVTGDRMADEVVNSVIFETAMSNLATPAIVGVTAGRKETTRLVDEVYARLEAEMDTPMRDQPESAADQFIEELGLDHPLARARHPLIGTMLPALGNLRATKEKLAARAEGVMIGIALELYRRQHGGYPESLDELTPRYLPELPVDRLNGEPLHYQVSDGRPVVYSVGSDMDDDGGRLPVSEDGEPTYPNIKWPSDSTENEGTRGEIEDGDWRLWPLHVKPTWDDE